MIKRRGSWVFPESGDKDRQQDIHSKSMEEGDIKAIITLVSGFNAPLHLFNCHSAYLFV